MLTFFFKGRTYYHLIAYDSIMHYFILKYPTKYDKVRWIEGRKTMQLFDAIENCFPAMEKQYQETCPPPEDFWPPVLMERALREEMVDWTQLHLLTPGLTALFERAGVTDRGMMARTMVQWFYYDKYSRE